MTLLREDGGVLHIGISADETLEAIWAARLGDSVHPFCSRRVEELEYRLDGTFDLTLGPREN